MERDISSKHHCTLQDTGLNYKSTTWCNGNSLFWGEVYSGEKCCKIQVNWSKWVFFGLCFVFRCVQHECAVNFKGETDYINL